MAVVNLPDGTRLNFPEGTPQAEILAAVERHMAQNQPSGVRSEDLPTVNFQALNPLSDVSITDLFSGSPDFSQPYSGAILPGSRPAGGSGSFDSDAGLVGPMKRALTLPGDVYSGKINPSSPEGMLRALEGAMMISPASMGGPKAGPRLTAPAPPTREALRDATKSGYREAEALGAEYSAASVKEFATDLRQTLDEKILFDEPEFAAPIHTLLKRLEDVPENPADPNWGVTFTLETLDGIRKVLGEFEGSITDPTKARAAREAKGALDEYIRVTRPTTALDRAAPIGPPTMESALAQRSAHDIITETRGNAAAGFRSDDVTGLEYAGRLSTSAANSGRNADNAARQRIKNLLLSKKGMRGFSPTETEFMEQIVFGTPTKNRARDLGNIVGGGHGLGGGIVGLLTGLKAHEMTGDIMTSALVGSVPIAAGAMLKGLANKMTKAEVKALDQLVRSRSPLQQPSYLKPGYSISPKGDAMLRALLKTEAAKQLPPPSRSIYDDGRS